MKNTPIESAILISLLLEWHKEWEEMESEKDKFPLNHVHRRIYEGMCNTQSARIRDLTRLLDGPHLSVAEAPKSA